MSQEQALLQRDRCLLVVIDAQQRLMPVIHDHQGISDNLERLVRFAGIVQLPILVTEQQKLGPTLPRLAQHLPGLEPVSKISFDCFGCPGFVQALEELGRDTLLLTGVESHICVAQTALSARGRYRVQVVSDAVGSRSPHNLQVALQRMRAAGVEITSTEMLIYELLGRAGSEEFKATLPLVK